MHILLRKFHGRLGAVFATGPTRFTSGAATAAAPRFSLGAFVALLVVTALIGLFALLLPASARAESGTLESLAGLAVLGNLDLYSTQTLLGVVENLKRKITGFAAMFFGTVVTSETETVNFDIDTGKRYIAPYVHPDVPAAVRGNKGRRVASFTPAYLKEKEPLRPGAALKRAAGESFATPLTPQARAAAMVGSIMSDQLDRIDRRVEQMAVEALVTGKIVVAGDGYPTQTVDFGRAAALNRTSNILTSTARWGQSAANPLKDLRTWNRKMLKESGAVIVDVILDADSADAFLDDPKVESKLDKLNVNIGVLELMAAQEEGLQLLGQIEGKRIWQYAGWYTNDAGTELELFSGGNVVCVGAVDGIQHYGAILDHDALQAMPVFPKSWLENDPSVRWIMSQSAPLPVPRRINATLVASVITGS